MRTPNEKTKSVIDTLKKDMKKIFHEQINPYVVFEENAKNTMPYVDFFKTTENLDDFVNNVWKCRRINWDKLNDSTYDYNLTEAKLDYELMKIVGKTCSEIMNYYKDNNLNPDYQQKKHTRHTFETKDNMYARIESAHEYPHNLRPRMSHGRLYGEETRAPKRKAASKKQCPVRVDFRKML